MMAVRQLDLQLTHRCNLRCTYCYASCDVSEGDERPADLDPDLARAAIDFLVRESGEAESLSVNLWGGEPFLRKDLVRDVAVECRARERQTGKRIEVHAPTNVTLLDAHARAIVSEYGIRLSLSLDGQPAAHTGRRTASGRSAWELVEPRLHELLDESPGSLPPVRMTVTPRRAHRLFDDVAYLHGLGFRQISFLPASGVPWDPDARSQLETEFDRIADSFVRSVSEDRPWLPYYPPILRRLAALWTGAQRGHLPNKSGSCGAGTTLVAADTTGDLYPCHRLVGPGRPSASLRLGTVRQGVVNRELRDRLARFSMDATGVPCATCASRSRCLSACIARNYQSTGDLTRPSEEACFVQQSLARVAGRIHRGLYGDPRYADYIRPYVAADPDERVLDWIAALGSDHGRLLDRITKELECSDPATEEEEEEG